MIDCERCGNIKIIGNMTPLLTLVLLVVIAFLGALVFKKYKLDNPIINSLAYTGSLYFVLGYILGPAVLDFINQKIIKELSVLYALVLGWAGFLIGLQANVKKMRRFPFKYYAYSLSNILIVLFISFGTLIVYSFYVGGGWGIVDLLVLSIAGMITSPIIFGIIFRDYRVVPEAMHILQFNSAFDNLVGVVAFGAVIAFASINTGLGTLGFALLFSVVIALIAVAIYYFLSPELESAEERFLLLLGLLFVVDGVALYFNQSLIFLSFLFGFGLANAPVKTRGLLQDITKLEKPMYVLLLIFVGVNLNFTNQSILPLLLLFFIIHLFSKIIAGYSSQFMLSQKYRFGTFNGMANIGLGGLSLAMILDFYLTTQSTEGQILLIAVTFTLVFQDAASWHYLRKTIVKKEKKQKNNK